MPILIVLLFSLSLGPEAGAEQAAPDPLTVNELRQQGWEVTDRTTRNETRPGLPPYENSTRVLSITTFTLKKGEQVLKCDIVYDSQLDSMEEHCSPIAD